MRPLRKTLGATGLLAIFWIALVWLGFRAWARYENTPGSSGAVPESWPPVTALPRAPRSPTLVLFAHPHCPCTRATLSELAQLMAQVQGKVLARVAFLQPEDAPSDWVRTDLWRDAAGIPGVTVWADVGGAEARRFGAETSGHAFLYDAEGYRLFDGGITGSRGHAGANSGRTAIQALLEQTTNPLKRTRVFGCSLRDGEETPNEHQCSR